MDLFLSPDSGEGSLSSWDPSLQTLNWLSTVKMIFRHVFLFFDWPQSCSNLQCDSKEVYWSIFPRFCFDSRKKKNIRLWTVLLFCFVFFLYLDVSTFTFFFLTWHRLFLAFPHFNSIFHTVGGEGSRPLLILSTCNLSICSEMLV